MARYESLLDACGDTPLVGLPRLSPVARGAAVGQAGGPQPDRQRQGPGRRCGWSGRPRQPGRLRPGDTILEPTSGNTGIALAMVAKLRGYRLVCVMPENVSAERIQLLRMYGAEIIFSPAAGGSNQAVAMAKQIAAEHPDWVMLYQYGNEANARAHYETHRPGAAARPADDHALRGRAGHHRHAHGHRAVPAREGRRTSRSSRPSRATASWSTACATSTRATCRSCTTRRVLTRRFSVGTRDAVLRTRQLVEVEGLFVGFSTGAVLHAALAVAHEAVKAGRKADVAFLVADGGWKYLSTGAYGGTLADAETALEGQLWA